MLNGSQINDIFFIPYLKKIKTVFNWGKIINIKVKNFHEFWEIKEF